MNEGRYPVVKVVNNLSLNTIHALEKALPFLPSPNPIIELPGHIATSPDVMTSSTNCSFSLHSLAVVVCIYYRPTTVLLSQVGQLGNQWHVPGEQIALHRGGRSFGSLRHLMKLHPTSMTLYDGSSNKDQIRPLNFNWEFYFQVTLYKKDLLLLFWFPIKYINGILLDRKYDCWLSRPLGYPELNDAVPYLAEISFV